MGLVRALQERQELSGSKILCPVPSVRGLPLFNDQNP